VDNISNHSSNHSSNKAVTYSVVYWAGFLGKDNFCKLDYLIIKTRASQRCEARVVYLF